MTRIKRNYPIWLMIHLKLTLQTWILKKQFLAWDEALRSLYSIFSMMCA